MAPCRPAAVLALQRMGKASAIHKKQRLLLTCDRIGDLFNGSVLEPTCQCEATRIDCADNGQARIVGAVRQSMMRVLSGLTVCKRFEAGCSTAKNNGAIAKLCALDRNIARLVPGMIPLL